LTRSDPATRTSLASEHHVPALCDFFRLPARAGFAVREMDDRVIDEEWVTALPGHTGPMTRGWVYEAA
jgi:hypothetical protein